MEDRVIKQAEQILNRDRARLFDVDLKSLQLDYVPADGKEELVHIQQYPWKDTDLLDEADKACQLALAAIRQRVGTLQGALIPVWLAQVKDAVKATLPQVDELAPGGPNLFPLAQVLDQVQGHYIDRRSNGLEHHWVLTSLQDHVRVHPLPAKVIALADRLAVLGIRAQRSVGTPYAGQQTSGAGRVDPILAGRFYGSVHIAVIEWA